jgi:hypothetical protein
MTWKWTWLNPRASLGTSGVTGPVLCWARPRRPNRYGVIAMACGLLPTLIGLSAVLVAVLIGVTVSEL